MGSIFTDSNLSDSMMKVAFYSAVLVVCLNPYTGKSQETFSDLVGLATSKDPSDRIAAALSLRDRVLVDGHAKLVPIYEKLLRDGNRDVVIEVLMAIKRTPLHPGTWSTQAEVDTFVKRMLLRVTPMTQNASPDVARLAKEAIKALSE